MSLRVWGMYGEWKYGGKLTRTGELVASKGAALKAGIQNHAATVDLMASLIVGTMVEILTSAASEERVGSGLLLMVEKVLYAMAFTDPKKDYELI